MRHVADRSGLTAGQVPGPGSIELLVDLLLLHRLAQLLVLPDGHDDRYHLAAMVNDIVGVTGGHLTHEDHGNEADRQSDVTTRQLWLAGPAASSRRFPEAVDPCQQVLLNVYTDMVTWGRWGSNPRPADYEKSGPPLPTLYLHGYREAVPPTRTRRSKTRSGRSKHSSVTPSPSSRLRNPIPSLTRPDHRGRPAAALSLRQAPGDLQQGSACRVRAREIAERLGVPALPGRLTPAAVQWSLRRDGSDWLL